MAKKQIKLNEGQLREFIAYSVARILKESAPIYRRTDDGEMDYDGELYDDERTEGEIMLPVFSGDFDEEIANAIWPLLSSVVPFDRETMDDETDWLDEVYKTYLSDVNDEIKIWVKLDENGFIEDYNITDDVFNSADEKKKAVLTKIVETALDDMNDGNQLREKLNQSALNEGWDDSLRDRRYKKHDDDDDDPSGAREYDDVNGIAPFTDKHEKGPESKYKKDGKFLTWDEYCDLKKKKC